MSENVSEPQKFKLPSIDEQTEKTICLVTADAEENPAPQPLLTADGTPLSLADAKQLVEATIKKAAEKISGEELEQVTLIADTYCPSQEAVTAENLDVNLKREAEYGVACHCGRFYRFKPKPDLTGWLCINGVYSEDAGCIFCDGCGAVIQIET